MTDEQIEGLVTRILQRLRPPVLVMVTAADGYRAAIRQRLAGCGYPLRLALEEGLADATAWREVGEIIPSSTWQDLLPSAPWRAVLLPFLDYPQASDLLNGTLRNPVSAARTRRCWRVFRCWRCATTAIRTASSTGCAARRPAAPTPDICRPRWPVWKPAASSSAP